MAQDHWRGTQTQIEWLAGRFPTIKSSLYLAGKKLARWPRATCVPKKLNITNAGNKLQDTEPTGERLFRSWLSGIASSLYSAFVSVTSDCDDIQRMEKAISILAAWINKLDFWFLTVFNKRNFVQLLRDWSCYVCCLETLNPKSQKPQTLVPKALWIEIWNIIHTELGSLSKAVGPRARK